MRFGAPESAGEGIVVGHCATNDKNGANVDAAEEKAV
jgi:hypothetical protein